MDKPMCEHRSTEWSILVDGDESLGRLLTNATGRGCRECLVKLADFWFKQDFVYSVAVVETSHLEAVR